MAETNWAHTRLYEQLGQQAPSQQAIVGMVLTKATTVLRSAGTAPIDFTLHDDEHSFRVAKRMAELLPDQPDPTLTTYEAALALLGAYLHDIGMSPQRDRVQRHHKFILTGEEHLLEAQEKKDLQDWLDREKSGLELPVEKGVISSAGLDLSEEILAYYVRHKHNDWSELWIKENLYNFEMPLYQGWVDDLIALCKSHHQGISSLRKSRFDAKLVGSPGQVVNLRYLAALLRIADVMEADP